MKLVKVILLVFLITKSALGFSLDFSGSCCEPSSAEQIEVIDQLTHSSDSDTDESDGCCDDQCPCVTCTALLYDFATQFWQTKLPEIPDSRAFRQQPDYDFSAQYTCWHPPQLG